VPDDTLETISSLIPKEALQGKLDYSNPHFLGNGSKAFRTVLI
jgi:hypothetical protein